MESVYSVFSPLPGDAGFTPIDFSGLKLWLDASDIAGTNQLLPLSNGSSIDKLFDKSDSRHALQDTPDYQPSFVYNVLDGKPNISFDGANDYLEFDSIDTIRTAFFVINRKTGNKGFYLEMKQTIIFIPVETRYGQGLGHIQI